MAGRRKRTKHRVIEVLRNSFPWVEWRYEWSSTWVSSLGWEVTAYSAYAPRYDGDDDSFNTEYRRSDTAWHQGLYSLARRVSVCSRHGVVSSWHDRRTKGQRR